jgi:hypothetical protein
MTDVITSLVEVSIGLAAIIFLYQRESSQFFEFAKQAAAYGGVYPQYQMPGYGQVPGYGQPPQYGQQAQYGPPPQQYGPPPQYGQPPQPPQA